MYILKRKSDSKYWADGPAHKYVRFGENLTRVNLEQWTEDVGEAKIFKTKSAAAQSRGIKLADWKWETCPIPYPRWDDPERNKIYEDRRKWSLNQDKARLKLIHDTYEVVEVEFRVKISDEVRVDA